jgi:hypothetical protein
LHKRHDIFHVRFVRRDVEDEKIGNAPVRLVGMVFEYVFVLQKFAQVARFVEIISLNRFVVAVGFERKIRIVNCKERIG